MNRKKILIPIIIFTVIIVLLIIVLNPISARYQKKSISESKWNNIISTRNENKNLVLEDIEFNDYNLIIDEKNNNLYYSLINESKNKYNPNVSFIASDKKAKIAILSDEITEEKVKSNYEFKLMIYNDKEYHIYSLICTDLPIININYKEEKVGNKQKNIPIEIYIFNNLSNTPNRITISGGKMKINENNYVFSLNMLTPGKNVRENKKSILSMKPNSEYILTPIINEQAETIVEDNEKNIGGEEPKNNRVELFINNEYKGVYHLGSIHN